MRSVRMGLTRDQIVAEIAKIYDVINSMESQDSISVGDYTVAYKSYGGPINALAFFQQQLTLLDTGGQTAREVFNRKPSSRRRNR